MEYTVQKLAQLAGVSARTLRYYDQIGLLRPARVSSSGYRIYGRAEVDTLQQILLYREMGVPLETISALLGAPDFDRLQTLRLHHAQLVERRARLDQLIETVRDSIAAEERGIPMEDNKKFEGFKQTLIDQNEERYGAEIREKYGDQAVDASNARLLGLSKEQYDEMEHCGAEVLRLLDEAFAAGDPRCAPAREAAETHRRWLGYTWSEYSPEAHAGLAEMYAADERFAAYYDRGTPGKAAFLRDCIVAWLEETR